MANRRMTVTLSPLPTQILEDGTLELTPNAYKQTVGQEVSFVNVLEGAQVTPSNAPPKPVLYSERNTESVMLMNYYPWVTGAGTEAQLTYAVDEGMTVIRSSDTLAASIYRQEMAYGEDQQLMPVGELIPIVDRLTTFHLRDYNITNNRHYRYYVYPANRDVPLSEITGEIATKWQGWSITELHPRDATMKNFSVSSSDVWVFNLNVETGDQAQNIVREPQQTLGQFPRFSQGRQNYISGSVTCLLGREVLPADWIERKSLIMRNGKPYQGNEWINLGGYQEKLPFSVPLSSNERIDMLKAWRKLVFSSNPKLLKDRKGQSFLVTLSEATNKPNDLVAKQPDTISFSWTQIGTLEGVQILDTTVGGK